MLGNCGGSRGLPDSILTTVIIIGRSGWCFNNAGFANQELELRVEFSETLTHSCIHTWAYVLIYLSPLAHCHPVSRILQLLAFFSLCWLFMPRNLHMMIQCLCSGLPCSSDPKVLSDGPMKYRLLVFTRAVWMRIGTETIANLSFCGNYNMTWSFVFFFRGWSFIFVMLRNGKRSGHFGGYQILQDK